MFIPHIRPGRRSGSCSRLGTRESYTDPETIYREALKQGMDFVTITDHNTIEGALILKERHPERVFTGVEVTTYFPETGWQGAPAGLWVG